MKPEIVTLGNGHFHVEITSPLTACMDKYGPRFETLGAVTAIRLEGENFCVHEGLSDEFNIEDDLPPPGYDEANPGESFVKIGVGELTRVDDRAYDFEYPYPVQHLAPVIVERQDDALSLFQRLNAGKRWGYEYRKTYHVMPESAKLVIQYELKNTGSCAFHAEQYNHNWFNQGGGPVDHNYTLKTKFDLEEGQEDWFRRQCGGIVLTGGMTEPSFFESPRSAPVEANWMCLSHAAKAWQITVSGDFRVARFALYADPSALCPEVFINIPLAPGEARSWNRVYEFKMNKRCAGDVA